jgi:ribosome-associated toxin RatA of RatAB toxin-antitoxin module
MAHQGISTIDIDATAEELFAIVTDYEAYPEWLSDVKRVEVLDTDGDGLALATTMRVDVTIREVEYTLDYTYEYPKSVSWKSRDGGDLKHIEGSYTFEINEDGGTTVTYSLEIDPGFPVPGFMLKRAAKHITGQALGGLRDRAEDA